jgi:hypothetical protein
MINNVTKAHLNNCSQPSAKADGNKIYSFVIILPFTLVNGLEGRSCKRGFNPILNFLSCLQNSLFNKIIL